VDENTSISARFEKEDSSNVWARGYEITVHVRLYNAITVFSSVVINCFSQTNNIVGR